MSEQNKAIVRRTIEELWTKGNLPLADALFAGNYIHHDLSTPDFGPGTEGQKKRVTFFRAAFPDLQFAIEEVVAEGQMVTCRWSCKGTHQGPLGGIAPCGKKVSVSGMSFTKLEGGKIVEGWVNWDSLTLLQQLNVVPVILKDISDADRPHPEWKTRTAPGSA